jgi:hypothetical protein
MTFKLSHRKSTPCPKFKQKNQQKINHWGLHIVHVTSREHGSQPNIFRVSIHEQKKLTVWFSKSSGTVKMLWKIYHMIKPHNSPKRTVSYCMLNTDDSQSCRVELPLYVADSQDHTASIIRAEIKSCYISLYMGKYFPIRSTSYRQQ